jgi:hypothetical protein
VHLQARVLADERPRGARVVEVDVAQEQVPEVAQRQPPLRQAVLERGDGGRRAAVEEREPVLRVEQVAADDALGAEMVEID